MPSQGMLERYYAMAALPKQSKLQLFCGIVVTRSGERLHSQDSLSYTRLRELFLAKLSKLGFDKKLLGFIVWDLEVQQQQPGQVSLTGCEKLPCKSMFVHRKDELHKVI